MTVSKTTSRWTPTGDGITVEFPYDNLIFDAADLQVFVDGVLQTLTTHYAVSIVGNKDGGNVTFVTPPADQAEIIILRSVDATQPTEYPSAGAFPAKSVEKAQDRLTILVQQLIDRVGRQMGLSSSATYSGSLDLPSNATATSQALLMDETGFALGPTADEVSSAQTHATNADASATASAGSASAALASENASALSASQASQAAASNMYASNESKSVDFAVVAADDGKQFLIDTSGGAVTVTLPDGATATDGFRFALGKTSADNNAVIVNRSGTDTINGSTAWQFSVPHGQSVITLDTTPAPDTWFAAGVGVASPVGVSDLHDNAKPYDIAFVAGFDTTMTAESVEVQTYGEVVAARTMTLTGEQLVALTAPTGAAAIFDIEKNGVSVYATKPQVAAGATTGTAGVLSTTAVAAGDRLTFKCTQVGSTVAGSGALFTLAGKLA